MSFFPVSAPTHTFELVPESLIGKKDPVNELEYRVRELEPSERHLHPPISEGIQRFLNARAGVKGLTNRAPLLPDEITARNRVEGSSSTYAAYVEEFNAEILAILRGEHESKDESTLTAQKGSSNNVDSSIHALGQNDPDILRRSELAEKASNANAERNLVSLQTLENPADSASRQKVFDLSAVFDPANTKDVELFGFSSSSDEESDEEVSALPGIENRKGVEEGPPSDDLDAELDMLIGESYGITGDLKNLRKSKSRAQRKKASEVNDVWAAMDSVDVSDFATLVPDMAIDYSFNLDIFQKRAVYRLQRDENVFVAAHTSAGKTVVAEYAIALALNRKTKVIYTSPIKTLSNQKYRDFVDRFGDVGIITGDMSINPEANCLIMTTEILRSMLYKGADLIRDLSHVIFDECHWLNDPERGVVWEESIILLPPEVTIVMLSATVPNAMEFAKWVGRTKQRPVYVVSTPKRPVPLSHQIFVKGEVYPLFDTSQKRFLEANYRRASTHHKESTKNANIRFGGGRNHAWMPLIKYLRKRDLDPAIFFCFSKKKCNEAADHLHNQDLTDGATEKNQIHMFYQSAISRLSPVDRNVPQVARHREMLKKGIGVHHAGVLPIIKEITEILFQRGLVRILFATETFAMGVNMPARTVVFTAIHKYDSQSFRLLEPGEYVQMAGRAGRRGLDEVGTVLMFPTPADFPTESDVKAVVTGTPKPLRSQFRLTYNMILNLLRIDELRVEDVMARSFSEAPAGRTSSTVKKLLQKGNATLNTMQGQSVDLERFREFYHMALRVNVLSRDISGTIRSEGKNATMSFLGTGRVVLVKSSDHTFRIAVIVRGPSAAKAKLGLSLKGPKSASISTGARDETHLKVLILCGGPALKGARTPYCKANLTMVNIKSENSQFNAGGLIVEIADIPLSQIHGITSIKTEVNERGIVPIRGQPSAVALSEAASKLKEIALTESHWLIIPSLHVRRDLALHDVDVGDYWDERNQLVSAINASVLNLYDTGSLAELGDACDRLARELKLEQKLDMLKIATADESLQLMPDYKQKAEVLQRLGYIDGTSVRLKGRAACEVNTCESIILTELVFEKVLQKLEAVDLAALLCSLVFTEKIGNEDNQSRIEELGDDAEELRSASKATLQVLFCLGNVQAECGVGVSGYEYMRGHGRFGFVRGVREWARGKSFTEICGLYEDEVPEGTIVRTIVRLCELLRELKNVGRVIGDPELQTKADEAVQLCRRDVIFAASLYVQ